MLKRERVNRRRYLTVADARSDVFDYIERFHNPRIQRRLDSLDRELSTLTQPSVTNGVEPEVLADLFARHGPPEHLRSDNGPEFTAKLVRRWLARLRVQTLLHRAGQSVGERLQRELQRQAEERVLERRDLLHTARGRRTRRAVAAGVQYRSTPQRLRRSTPRSGSIETITLVPQNASAPGTANGFRSNIASGTAGGGTPRLRRP